MSRATAAVEALRKRNPDAIRLAEMVSFAAMVDRPLLRAARLALIPEADADAEADLWFSGLVQSRTADGIVLDREVAEEVRRQMPAEKIDAAWDLTRRAHDPWLPPSLKLEEEVAYLSVSNEPGARDRMAERIQSVVRAMLRGDRPGLAQWATRALAMFPSAVRDLPESKMLDAGARLRLGRPIETTEAQPLPDWLPLVAPSDMKRTSITVELRERELVLAALKPAGSTSPYLLSVPDTNPIVLEVRWDEEGVSKAKQVTLRPGETVRVPVGSELLRLMTIEGEEFELREQPMTSAALQAEVIDFSAEMARHTTFYGREKEMNTLLEATGAWLIPGSTGIGKTALLCELVRRLAPAPVFVHFFRAGEYRLESLEFAQRSIAAQIALRYHLDEAVVDLPLVDVLARLALSPRCPSRLYIVLDDVDDARDVDRNRVADPRPTFLRLPSFVTVFASTTQVSSLVGLHLFELWSSDEIIRLSGANERLVFPSQGSPGKAEVLIALANAGYILDVPFDEIIGRALDAVPDGAHEELYALSVARCPLPEEMASNLLSFGIPLISVQDGRVGFINDLARMVVSGRASAQSHRHLVEWLRRYLSTDAVAEYYVMHAPSHLIEGGDVAGARRLCDSKFIAEVVRRCDLAVIRIHQSNILKAGTTYDPRDSWIRAAVDALEAERDAVEAAPDEIEAILGLYLPTDTLPEYRPRLVRSEHEGRMDRLPRRRHDAPVTGCALIGQEVPTSWSSDGLLMVWQRRDTPIVVDHGSPITAFAELAGGYAITGDSLGFLRAIRTNGNLIARIAAHDDRVVGITAAEGARLVASWSTDGVIKLWSIVDPGGTIDFVGDLSGHEQELTGCAFVGGGRFLVSSSSDGTIRTWDVAEQRTVSLIRNETPVTGMVVSSDGQWLAAVDEGRRLLIVPVEAAGAIHVKDTLIELRSDGVVRLEISPDDRSIATWSSDGSLVVLDIPPAAEAASPAVRYERQTSGRGSIVQCTFLFFRRVCLLVSWSDGTSVMLDVSRDSDSPELFALRPTSPVRCAVDGSGESFFTGDERGVLVEWDGRNGRKARDLSEAPDRIEAVVCITGLVLTASEARFEGGRSLQVPHLRLDARGRNAIVWWGSGVRRIKPEKRRFDVISGIEGVSLCTIGTSLDHYAIAYRNGNISLRIRLRPLQTVEGKRGVSITAMAFAYDDNYFLFASDDRSITSISRESRRTWAAAQAPITRIEVDDMRRRCATVGLDGSISVRDLDELKVQTTIRGGVAPALGCRFSLDGRALVAALDRHILGIWDPTSGEQIANCVGHRAPITGFDVADKVIYSCSEDRTIRMWDDKTGEQLEVVYGYNAFRCISAHDDEIMAGDDAGKVWRFRRGVTLRAESQVSSSASAVIDDSADTLSYISYSRKDKGFAMRLKKDLLSHGIRTVEPDTMELAAGTELLPIVNDRIKRATSMIVILSESSILSRWVGEEVRVALQRPDRPPIVPVVIDETDPSESEFTYLLSKGVDFRNWQDPTVYEERLKELIDGLQPWRRA